MILLFNVKITQYGLSHYDRAPWLPKYDRVDIFKYCLASYTAIQEFVSRNVFFIELAPEFLHRKAELEKYIYELYPDCDLYWYRNFLTQDWRNNWEKIVGDDNDPLIWFNGNDDHIFIDYNLDVLESGIDHLISDPDPMSVVIYSHWSAMSRMSFYHDGQLTESGDYVKFNWRTYDAIRIIKTERFKHYWFDHDFGNLPVFRTDALWHAGHNIVAPVYAPTRELVRHYDGDSHLGNGVAVNVANITPPLVIPPGFFDNNINIRFGYRDRRDDWVNIDATNDYFFAADPKGTDYRWIEDDIPMFWKSRVKSIETSDDYNISAQTHARNTAMMAIPKMPMNCYSILFDSAPQNTPPEIWYSKHLRYCD